MIENMYSFPSPCGEKVGINYRVQPIVYQLGT